MTSIKMPNPGVDKPYGPVSGGKNAKGGISPVYGLGGETLTYGPAAKPDRKPKVNRNDIPTGYTCRKLNEMG